MAEVDGPSPGSTLEQSEMDERMTTQASSPIRADPRTSLQHVLGDTESQTNTPSAVRHTDLTEDEDARTPAAQEGPKPTSRKRRDGAASILANPGGPASGNKIKHLKKDDGEPLWRKDIQYDFLKAIFHNEQAVFTNSYEPPGSPLQTFSQLYIDAMARSSKTSKILRDKLLTEHEPARNMAMVCLLVNLGRMNTTLNCKYKAM
jgi:Ino eighty subunit 1